ncbi:hypothetical protein BS78_K127800 [Paspalum vaginatum]|uniref:Uncharacterized protein n=1 Tax=Paspalum vaginatum TaxID=158149 RepID=A0A9W7XCD6_9POAL|nr:hypothetical protein BS78_K127800 [Paspalum vaginatum]
MRPNGQHSSSHGIIYRPVSVQVHDGPRIFCDASVGCYSTQFRASGGRSLGATSCARLATALNLQRE